MRINLYGGPGSGKSLAAAWLYDTLRREQYNLELVREVIKPMAYRGDVPTEWECLGIFQKQHESEREFLQAGVPHIVTDSPLLLQCYYLTLSAKPYGGCLALAHAWEVVYPSVNIFLTRSHRVAYEQAGRYQDKEAATRIDATLAAFLRQEGIAAYQFEADNRPDILDFVRSRLRDAPMPPALA